MTSRILLAGAAAALIGASALLSMTVPAAAEETLKIGQPVAIDATFCTSEASARRIADAAERTGTGADAYRDLKRAGQCSSALAHGTIVKVIAEFDDTRIGHTRIVQLRVRTNGHSGDLYGLVAEPVEPASSVSCVDCI